MSIKARLVGVELYFDNLPAARRFYREELGLEIEEETPGHHTKFRTPSGFFCVEGKGVENYPSRDKAVLFFEVEDLQHALAEIGEKRFVHVEPSSRGRAAWAVLHDPEGHNVLLLQARHPGTKDV